MKERSIPFSIGDYHTLVTCSPIDLGLFRKFFKAFEFSNTFGSENALTQAYNLKALFAVSGYSIFNKFRRMRK